MAKHALRRKHNERLAPRAQGLTTEQMEILRSVGGLSNDHIVAGSKLEKALYAGGGVLRPLAVVAMRQQHDNTGEQTPLGFAGCDELIDDALRAVDEVAELRLPEDEGFG